VAAQRLDYTSKKVIHNCLNKNKYKEFVNLLVFEKICGIYMSADQIQPLTDWSHSVSSRTVIRSVSNLIKLLHMETDNVKSTAFFCCMYHLQQLFDNVFVNGQMATRYIHPPVRLHSSIRVALVADQVSRPIKQQCEPGSKRGMKVIARPRHVIVSIVDVWIGVMPCPE